MNDIRPVAILGTGHALPATAITSEELDRRLNHRPGTIERVGGVASAPTTPSSARRGIHS